MSPATDLVCKTCGQPEAHAMGDEILCAECCHARGSCGAAPEIEIRGVEVSVKPGHGSSGG